MGALSDKPNHPVQLGWDGGLPLKNHPQKVAQRGTWQWRSFHHQPWQQRTCLTGASQWRETSGVPPPLTYCWRTSLEDRCLHLGWKGAVFGEVQHPNPPLTRALNGSRGKPTRSTIWPGGQNCLWSPERERCVRIHKEGLGVMQTAQEEELCPGYPQWLLCTPCPSGPRMWLVPAYFQHHVWWAGLLHAAAAEDLGICQSPAVLGWEGPAATSGQTLPISGRLWELCQAMEPLATLTDAEVLEDNPPSNWQMITPSRPTEPEQPDQGNQRERSHGRKQRACARGTFVAAHGVGHSQPTVTTWAASPLLVPTQWAESPCEECCGQQLAPPPGFVEVMRSLHGDGPPHKALSIPLKPAEEQGTIWIIDSMMMWE